MNFRISKTRDWDIKQNCYKEISMNFRLDKNSHVSLSVFPDQRSQNVNFSINKSELNDLIIKLIKFKEAQDDYDP